jgi:type I restriction enzyme S subunit
MDQEQELIETEIGRIPSDWKIKKLKNLCIKIGSGATPRGGANIYVPSGIALIRSQNVYDGGFNEQGLAFINEDAAEKLKNVEVREHDVLLNITGDSICRASIVPKEILPARVNQHVSILRTNEKLYYRFLFYFLSLNKTKNKLLSYDAGGTRQALTKSMLEEFHVPLPEYEEQVKIGDFFWTITEKIALNRLMNSTLEAIGQALFKCWFVDFEFPNEKGKPYKSNGGEMVETELGEIPKGWRVVENISELCKLINYGYTQSSVV